MAVKTFTLKADEEEIAGWKHVAATLGLSANSWARNILNGTTSQKTAGQPQPVRPTYTGRPFRPDPKPTQSAKKKR